MSNQPARLPERQIELAAKIYVQTVSSIDEADNEELAELAELSFRAAEIWFDVLRAKLGSH